MHNKKILVMSILLFFLFIFLAQFRFSLPIFSRSIETKVSETTNNLVIVDEETLKLNQEIGLTGNADGLKDTLPKESETEYSNIIYGNIGNLSSENVKIGISKADPFVNVRELPDKNSTIVGKLYKDAAAAIISYEGNWVKIESGTVKGFINVEYLNLDLTTEEIIEQYGKLKVLIATDGLNVRAKTTEESKRLTVVYSNEVYPVLDVKDDWIQISMEDDNMKGYVAKEYVNLIVNYPQAVSLQEEQALLRLNEETAEETAKVTASTESLEEKKSATVSAPASSPKPDYSKEELKLLASLVHAESGNQPYEGKLAVANVVLNRVNSSTYPNSIKDVIYQPGQFTVASSGSLQKQLDNYSNYSTTSQKLSIEAARSALEGNNNIGDALYFNRYSASRSDAITDSVRIEDHLFWK